MTPNVHLCTSKTARKKIGHLVANWLLDYVNWLLLYLCKGAAWGLLRSRGRIFVLPDTRRARSRAWVLVIAFLVYPEDAGQVCVGGSSEGLLIHAAACVQSSSELSPCVQCPIYIYGGVTSDACILEPALSFDIVEEGITVRWLWY